MAGIAAKTITQSTNALINLRTRRTISSLRPEAFHRINHRRPQRADTQNDERDQQKRPAAGREDPPADRGLIREILQPFTAAPPGNGYGDEDGEGNEFEEVAGEEDDQVGDAGADDLADADLFCPLVGDIDDQAEETETADKDGETRGPGQEAGDVLFRGVELCDGVVDEFKFEVIVWIDRMKGFLNGGDGRRPVGTVGGGGLELYIKDGCIFGAVCDDKGFYLVTK